MFEDQQTHTCVCPVLESLGLTPHQKVPHDLMAMCPKTAAGLPYAKVSQYVTGGELSRQTVWNYVKESADVALYDIPEKKRQVKILHVDMDEDHIALQHVPRKKHTAVPFGVVSEGLRKEGRGGSGRKRLINPKYFTDVCLSTKDPAAETAGYIAASYDTLFPEKVYVHGDAGGWIRTAPEDTTGADTYRMVFI